MENKVENKREFTAAGKTVAVYPATAPGAPVIYLNTFGREGDAVCRALQGTPCPDFSLVAISGLAWDHDMAPWEIPPICEGDTPCTGGADDYLALLTREILPRAEALLLGQPGWRGLAGYSLGGLFAVYAIYKTALFSRIASVSGSLWFPEFKEYVLSQPPPGTTTRLYFSLGDKECRTQNPYLKTVQTRTGEIEAFFAQHGADTVFKLNPGNHYKNAAQRTAAGIIWLLGR